MNTSSKTRPGHSEPPDSGIIASPVMPVQAEPINAPAARPVYVEPDRKLSWLAWVAAFALFIFNRKLGLVFFVILLIFKQYPRLSLGSKKTRPKNRS